MESSPLPDARASLPDQHAPQPLSAVAQQAYDRYGVLDPVKLDLMVHGIFITREDAAALPSRITADGCPEYNALHTSHHSRPPRSQAATRGGGAVVAGAAARAPSAAPSSAARSNDISAVPSDNEKWTDGEVDLIIRMRAERVGFKFIAERFPTRNQKAVQEKFYKSVKDHREPHWKRLYDDLRAQHDGAQHEAGRHEAAVVDRTGTFENPIEIEDEDTAMNPIVISSGSVSEATTVVEADENRVEDLETTEDAMEDVQMIA